MAFALSSKIIELKICKLVLKYEPFIIHWGGVITIGLLSENYHKTNPIDV
jgi:hypothetical protein